MTTNMREGRFPVEEVRSILKKVCRRHNLVVFKCLDKDNKVVYSLGDSLGVIGKDFQIQEKLDLDFFVDNLDVYGGNEDTLYKFLKVDNVQAAKVFTSILDESNRMTVSSMKCLDGTFSYNSLNMDSAIIMLKKFMQTTSTEDLRIFLLKVKSSGWDGNKMADAFTVFLKKNMEAFNSNHKSRDFILSQLKGLYPRYVSDFNEALGIVPPAVKMEIFDTPEDFKLIELNPKAIAKKYVVPFVDSSIETGYYNALVEFIKYLNTEDGLDALGAKGFELNVGGPLHPGKWLVKVKTTPSFSQEIFESYIVKCYENLVELSKKGNSSVTGASSSHLIMAMSNMYSQILDETLNAMLV